MRVQILLVFIIPLIASTSGVMAQPAAQEAFIADITTQAKPWTHLNMNNDPADFQFVIMSDRCGGKREGIFQEAVAKVNLLQPEFAINIGDMIEGYDKNQDHIRAMWDEFVPIVSKLEMPFFFVAGNHDNGMPTSAEVYRERFGAEYYHFVYKNVLFLCLSTNTGPDNDTGISQEQALFVAQTLREHPDVRWTLVFQHQPIWNNKNNKDWDRIASLLKGRKCSVFAGHTHHYVSQVKDGISYVTLSTTGGISQGRGTGYGEFDQVVWVTITDEGPRVANLLLDGILDKDMRTPDMEKELQPFMDDKVITASPIITETPGFTSGVSHLKITNPSEKPVRVRILSEVMAGLRIEPVSIFTVVPGKGEYTADIQVTTAQPIPGPAVQPIVLHWECWYDHTDNTPPAKIDGTCSIPIDSPFEIPHTAKAPMIDGRLDDWAALPYQVRQPAEIWHNPQGWKGPQDGTFEFAVMADDEYLYGALRAKDDEPSFDGWRVWEDMAGMWVDPNGVDSDKKDKSVFCVVTGPKISPEQAAEADQGKVPEGVKSSSQATADGFEAEFAIPLSLLKEQQGGDWKQVRLNFGFRDFDRADERDGISVLMWRPKWDRSYSYPQSGVFHKETPK